ncbi:hypothetical protein PoB_000886000 [Plakobranchus ocellatus]|uniref:Uncharacterized protein n=1 Tax=Plakobranchus ocellatus TaxID=259542 RepID=A0AAV3YH03_9GAST|nr:hypothetical protein PoB_000886000 [Plakobranchus ocellatus]
MAKRSIPQDKKVKAKKTASKFMATAFCDIHDATVVNVLARGMNIKGFNQESEGSHSSSRFCICQCPPHTSLTTKETLTSTVCMTLPHPPYPPVLTPSDFRLFGPMQEDLKGHHYGNNKEFESAVKT